MKKIIIFDLDNTFYNYQESHDLALNSVFNHQTLFTDYELFGNEYLKARKKVKTILKNSTSKNNRSIYFKLMLENINFLDLSYAVELEKLYWSHFINKTSIDNTVIKTLKKKKSEDTVYHLYTNLDTNTQLMKLNIWKLNLFDKVVTSEEAGYEKPDKNFISFVEKDLNKLLEKKFKFYAVGDSVENDLKPWKIKYEAKTFLINNIEESNYVDYTTDLKESLDIIFKD